MKFTDLEYIYNKKKYTFNNIIEPYIVNIFGIRMDINNADLFNDYICIAYRDDKCIPIIKFFNGTTDPGSYYLKENMINPKGTAILIPDQYKDVYSVGIHNKGKKTEHLALIQTKPMKYWRDNNKNGKIDIGGKVYEEIAYTNIHRASAYNTLLEIDQYSAGCQVISNPKDFYFFINICEESKRRHGNSFTYTLFNKEDFKNYDIK